MAFCSPISVCGSRGRASGSPPARTIPRHVRRPFGTAPPHHVHSPLARPRWPRSGPAEILRRYCPCCSVHSVACIRRLYDALLGLYNRLGFGTIGQDFQWGCLMKVVIEIDDEVVERTGRLIVELKVPDAFMWDHEEVFTHWLRRMIEEQINELAVPKPVRKVPGEI